MVRRAISELWGKVNIVSISLFGGCLIAVCVLVLSYAHTTALFERSGYRSILAHIGVIGFEAAFVLGTVTLIWAKLNGEKVRISTRCVFGLGIAFNLYSNISSGIAKNGQPIVFYVWDGIVIDEAVLVGALIPLLIEAAVLVISDAIVQYRKQTVKQPIRQTVKQSNGQAVKQSDQTIKQTVKQAATEQPLIKQPDEQTSKQPNKQQTAVKQADKQTVKQTADDQTGKQAAGQTIKQQPGIKQTTKQSDDQTVKHQTAVKQPTAKQTNEQKDNQTADKQTGKQPNKQTDSQTLETIALRLKKELGDWPSYRRLAQEANTTPYQAGQTLKRLKQQAS